MDHPDAPPSSSPRLVVIAASAGGLQAMIDVLAPLPADFPAAVAIVQHRGAARPERLREILARELRLRVRDAVDGAPLEPGTVYLCPPGMHMTTEHCVRLLDGPKIQHVRPNADRMLESVGRAYGERAVGVVLSGMGTDGALGTAALARAGATVIVQDPDTSRFRSMPETAARTGAPDLVLPPADIARALERWTAGRALAAPPLPAPAPARIRVVVADDHQMVLEGLRVLLEGEPDMKVVAVARDGAGVVDLAGEHAPDVVVLDLRMPGLDGAEAARRILARAPGTRVVVLSSESDALAVDRVLQAGVTGYLTKSRAFGELVQAIRAVLQGRTYFSQEIARLLARGDVRLPPERLPR